ncbi:MAG: hypothetical protein ACI3Z5_05150 [Paludibacteraceae bacterium]
MQSSKDKLKIVLLLGNLLCVLISERFCYGYEQYDSWDEICGTIGYCFMLISPITAVISWILFFWFDIYKKNKSIGLLFPIMISFLSGLPITEMLVYGEFCDTPPAVVVVYTGLSILVTILIVLFYLLSLFNHRNIEINELHLPQGNHKLKFQVQLFYNHEAIACSDFYDFTVNWQGEPPKKTKPTDNKIRGKVSYPDIKSIIQKVINYTPDGSAVISIGELYVQFYAPNENTLYVEAVSEVYSRRVGNKDSEFKRIGYTIDRVSGKAMSNYHKEYSVRELLAMIKEIVYIFEEIYRVDFIDYKIDDNC